MFKARSCLREGDPRTWVPYQRGKVVPDRRAVTGARISARCIDATFRAPTGTHPHEAVFATPCILLTA
ncbi:hypothetical protein GCM10010872_13980 [Dyella flava]|nr:hypothetical protein GCM10010872_13980 [Dyella flava]